MFKIEVTNLLGEKENHYWMNKKGDDFLRFLPRLFGVPKENIEIYRMEDEEKDQYEAYLRSHENNESDLNEEPGAIKVKRRIAAELIPGETISKEEYEEARKKREQKTKGLSSLPASASMPAKKAKQQIEVAEDDPLTKETVATVKEFRGKKMSRWPYDKNGNFLGNYCDDEL